VDTVSKKPIVVNWTDYSFNLLVNTLMTPIHNIVAIDNDCGLLTPNNLGLLLITHRLLISISSHVDGN
jgi:hypothetical protein